jgi:hypothetical protein
MQIRISLCAFSKFFTDLPVVLSIDLKRKNLGAVSFSSQALFIFQMDDKLVKQKRRHYTLLIGKVVILGSYLLIVFGSLVLNPYVMILLSGGFLPVIKQPAFAYAIRHYNYVTRFARYATVGSFS